MNRHLQTRRHWLRRAAAAATALPVAAARAQPADAAFPSRPLRLIVPFAPGGGTDVLARLIAQQLALSMGQAVVVDNRVGAAGIVGTDAVAKAPADGHTVLLSLSNSLLTNQFLYDKLPYDVQRDLALVYQVASAPLLLVVHPALPVKTGPELLKYVAAQKGRLAYGSYGVGAYPHLAGAHLSATQHADMSHVPYKGEAPMLQDLVGGQIQMAFASALIAKPQIEAGRLRAIGVTGDRRVGTLPDVPTLAEQGLTDEAYRVTGWFGVAVPAATPKPVLRRLAAEVHKATHLPDVQQRIAAMGFEPKDSSPEAFRAAYEEDRPVWERLIRQSGARLE